MSKAEEKANKWYNSVKYKSDLSGTPISGYIAGYQQAEKDLMADATETTIDGKVVRLLFKVIVIDE